jgi:hypothetical protein
MGRFASGKFPTNQSIPLNNSFGHISRRQLPISEGDIPL